MSREITRRTGAGQVSRAVTITMWALAVGAPALVLHVNGVRAAQQAAESQVLQEVATTIQSPAASREQVFTDLARHERELSDTRYVRVCSRLGMPMDWNSLFAQIAQRDKNERTRAARIIAEECGLDPSFSLKREQMYLSLRVLQAPSIERTLPILGPVPRSID